MKLTRTRRSRSALGIALLLAALLADSFGQSGGSYKVTQSAIPGGGGESTAGTQRLAGAIGQPVVGASTGGAFKLEGGFFSGPVPSTPSAAPATISGGITTVDGRPLGGVVVRLINGTQVRRSITSEAGQYFFNAVEVGSFCTITPERANYAFSPSLRSFSLLGNVADAGFTALPAGEAANPLDTPEFFVRQQYLDFLGREPDQFGLDYWSAQLQACGAEPICMNQKRIGVSAAFFIEREFQASGSYIYDVYSSALGRRPRFAEYYADRTQVVGGASLEAAKIRFAEGFVQREEFMTKYQNLMTAESFVDALIQNVHSTTVDLSGERDSLIVAYNSGNNTIAGRAAVVRAVADNATFKQSQYNQAFVLMEYFGYLRRDADSNGYNFWLNVLNNGGGESGNYRGMVCAFITSTEYQRRFGSVVSQSNGSCAQ